MAFIVILDVTCIGWNENVVLQALWCNTQQQNSLMYCNVANNQSISRYLNSQCTEGDPHLQCSRHRKQGLKNMNCKNIKCLKNKSFLISRFSDWCMKPDVWINLPHCAVCAACRDLKVSNLLMTDKGCVKIGESLIRYTGSDQSDISGDVFTHTDSGLL